MIRVRHKVSLLTARTQHRLTFGARSPKFLRTIPRPEILPVTRLSFLLVALVLSLPLLAQDSPRHDRDYWRAIARNGYRVPESQQAFPLMRELSGYLGSPDSEMRDDLAYSILTTWTLHNKQLSAEELNSLADGWRANLRAQAPGDAVLLRSFSALVLSGMAERDLKEPFLGVQRYRRLLDDALDYLGTERDLRGFDSSVGWIHATAHTADLLATLAANPLFKKEDQARVLNAIATRLSSAGEIFTFGEQDRLAFAAATIVKRKDFDPDVFSKWLAGLDEDKKVWSDSPPRLELLRIFENNTYMLRGLAASLCGDTSTEVTNARDAVLKSLQRR